MKKPATALSALIIAAVASAAPALASERVNTLDLSSAQVKQIVQEQGAVLLSTGPDLFDRYVANGSYCYFGEHPKAAFVPTADSDAALVGYTCDFDHDNDNG